MHDNDGQENPLDVLAKQFVAALALKRSGKLDKAEDELKAIIRAEPRLPEPHMEVARLLLDSDRLADAESHAREALAHLDASGPWTDEIPSHIVRGLAWALLAETLRRIADEDDVIFGDPDRFRALLEESQDAFSKAAKLDPSDEYASYHAFFLGPQGHGSGQKKPS
jgi:tetratricopeptide (TPR) repeat protein